MGKTHDENQDVRLLNKHKVFVNSANKTIRASKEQTIGNKLWGRIDYLVHYCGYNFMYDNSTISKVFYTNSDKKAELKQIKKENKHQLTNKLKKSHKHE